MHAEVVWHSVSIDEAQVGYDATSSYGALLRWCQARGCHIRDLRVVIAQVPPIMLLSDPENVCECGECTS